MFARSLLIWITLASPAWADETWPQFRGPTGLGHALPGGVAEWSGEKNLAWKTPLPGTGWSAPVVAGDRIFLTTAIGDKLGKPKNMEAGAADPSSMMPMKKEPPKEKVRYSVLCLDRATGKVLWEKVAVEQPPPIPIHPSNTHATETPVTDGERVLAYFGMIGLFCFDRNGELLWSRKFEPYEMGAGFGTGSSLALADGRVFVQCDNEKKSFIVAFDVKSGKELWQAERASKSSWSTPLVWRNKLRTELVCCGSTQACAYDPATGKVLWSLKGVPGSFASSPAANEEVVIFGNSGPMSVGPLLAVSAGAAGELKMPKVDGSSEYIPWYKTKRNVGLSSPIIHQGLLYFGGQGTLTCVDITNGEQIYKERLPGGKIVVASAWSRGDQLFFLDEAGKTFVVAPGRQFKLLRTNSLDDTFWSTPAIAGDDLIVRGVNCLYCIRPTPTSR